jgi:hypothetical protein
VLLRLRMRARFLPAANAANKECSTVLIFLPLYGNEAHIEKHLF